MPDDILDTTDKAQGTDQTDQEEQVDTQQADHTEEPGKKKFSDMNAEEQSQFMGSWMGRIVKKQIEESVLPEIQRLQPAQSTPQPGQENDALAKFNEQLQEKIFAGDVLGALQMANQVQKTAEQKISSQQKIAVDREIVNLSDKPFYKDIYTDMKKIAHEATAKGFPAAAAADYAYNKAIAERSVAKEKNNPSGLTMLKGGTPRSKVTEPKLPAAFKKAAERDIASGVFKDEADYIANLSPHIRSQYGI